MKILALAYLAYSTTLSLITFVIYGWDKRQAKQNGWRVPEKRLHRYSLLGGWPGAIAGQQFFRHKTQKWKFKAVATIAAVLHLLAIGGAVYAILVWG